jgi:hypothetical protein
MVFVIKTTGIEDFLDNGESNLKALIMGAPSAGKTRSASYWPKPIFADCEKGRMSIADRSVPYGEIKTTADMDAMLRMLELECRRPKADRRYSTLVIDTLDAYQRIVMQERLDAEHKDAFSGWKDWGYLDGKMSQFVAKLQKLSMNIVVNLHVKDSMIGDDEDAKTRVTGPKLKGDLKDQIAAEFDLVGFMGTYWAAQDGERVLKRGIQWHPDPGMPILKDRSGQLPKWTAIAFHEDDYNVLFSTLIGHLDNLTESTVVETLETAPEVVTPDPVPPTKGGPVAGAAIAPAPAPRKAVPAKTAPPKAAPAAAEAQAAPVQAQAATPGAPPISELVKPPVAAAPPPAARKPEIPGASAAPVAAAPPVAAPAPQQTPTPVATPVAEPVAAQEVVAAPVEAEVTPEQGVANAEAALGASVISEPVATDEAPTEVPVEQEAVEAPAVPAGFACGESALSGEEGQAGAVTGCGKFIDLTVENPDIVQIAALKTRTHLCNACYAAARAAKR